MDLSTFHLLKQGAEARLYTGTFLGQPAIVKERFSKTYRHPELDSMLTRERFKAEARALLKCKALGVRVPTMYLCDNETSLLVMEHMVGALTARDYINTAIQAKDEEALQRIAGLLGELVGRLHTGGLIHGDITTSNILVEKVEEDTRLVLIDFGLSFQEGTAEDKGVDLYVLERAFLSTHPNTEHVFRQVLQAYSVHVGSQAGETMKKFEEIRLRGRKRTMLG